MLMLGSVDAVLVTTVRSPAHQIFPLPVSVMPCASNTMTAAVT